jgi:SulP family sulfate permease
LLGYAAFGTCRQLKVTTSSSMAIMSAAVIAPLAVGDAARYLALSAGLALVVGLVLVVAGFVRLGFISDFLSKSVVTGFVFGLAITILVGQLPKLFGLTAGGGNVFQQLWHLLRSLGDTNGWALLVGGGALVIILGFRWFVPRVPGALVALILGIVVSRALGLPDHGVTIVGEFTRGLPTPGLPGVRLFDLPYLALGAIGIVFLAVGESLGAARAFGAKYRYSIDPDQELIALGAANLASGFFRGFAVDASLSQTATADAAGVRSQASSLLTSGMILLTLVFLGGLFRDLPNAVLGAVVIAAVLGLMDVAEMRRFAAQRHLDFVIALVALLGVITTDVLAGMIVAVVLSLVMVLAYASRPRVAVLGRVPGQLAGFGSIERHPENQTFPGLLVLRPDVPLYFFNSNMTRIQVLDLVAGTDTPTKAVILDLSASADFDVTAADALRALVTTLDHQEVDLLLAQVRGPLRDRLRISGLMELIGEAHVFTSVADAVEWWLVQPR